MYSALSSSIESSSPSSSTASFRPAWRTHLFNGQIPASPTLASTIARPALVHPKTFRLLPIALNFLALSLTLAIVTDHALLAKEFVQFVKKNLFVYFYFCLLCRKQLLSMRLSSSYLYFCSFFFLISVSAFVLVSIRDFMYLSLLCT